MKVARFAVVVQIVQASSLGWPQDRVLGAYETQRREEIVLILRLIEEQGFLARFPPEQATLSEGELYAIPPELLQSAGSVLTEEEAFNTARAGFEAIFANARILGVRIRPIPNESEIRFLPRSSFYIGRNDDGPQPGWLPYWDGWFDVDANAFAGGYSARVDLVTGDVMIGPDLHQEGVVAIWTRQSGEIEYYIRPGGQ